MTSDVSAEVAKAFNGLKLSEDTVLVNSPVWLVRLHSVRIGAVLRASKLKELTKHSAHAPQRVQ